ncbi:MAG: isoprenylcysteine carboxylmethyltransferase family protein [Anaerolineales bacterium]|uniref:methyltransferase family protein n=1 Tax=Candidatus Villigracilis vicinus TaxID=3140679 RepID=UPI003135E069|nr:isoprenylcysteine carboxylmethyltransferase family protein [Anaerolineales bacterium]
MRSLPRYFLALLAGSIIFIGLPLLGWGLGNLPTFFENPARIAFVVVIFALQVFSLIYNPQVGQNQENRKNEAPRSKLDLILIQIFSLAVVILAPYSDSHSIGVLNAGNIVRYTGLLITIPGFVLMQAGEKYLAKQFSIEVTLQKDHKLIQNGPYKVVRHPRYLGILIFFTGVSLTFRSLLGIFTVLALALVLIWRVFAEEKMMHEEFGKEWEEYQAKTWRLVPYIF